MRPCIYTIGIGHSQMPTIIRHLKMYGVNCVIDIRTNILYGVITGLMPEDMREGLSKEGINYMLFTNEFGLTPLEAQSNKGETIYTKLIKQPNFLQGVERVRNGISKGYTIAIMDSDSNVYKSRRHNIIAKYFDSIGIDVKHIENDGSVLFFETIDNVIAKHNNKDKKYDAIELGKNGEEIAGMHLIRKGHTILDMNWNLHHGCELDIVTRKDGVIYFVEVKTRQSDERGTPHLAIDRKKIHNMTMAIKEYILRNDLFDLPYKVMSIALVYRSEEDYDIDFLEWGNNY